MAWLGLLAWPAWGCDIPVYRWALERWAPDPYEVVVFREASLDAVGQGALERLKAGVSRSNMAVREVETGSIEDELTRGVWEAQSGAELPWMVVRHPIPVPAAVKIWAGSLDEQAVEAAMDSPKRRETAEFLLQGDAVVWVLLDGDDATAKALEGALEEVRRNPPEPVQTPGAAVARSFPMPRFPVVRVSRTDPAERAFVEMLLGVEPDLKRYAEPMAFPVFGRGRALYALVGAGINPQTVRKACAFLVGACSCQVKEENPGMDLLIAADWSKWDEVAAAAEAYELPPLPGVIQPPAPEAPRSAVLRNLLLTVGLGAILVAGASVALWKRRESRLHG